VNYVVSVLFVNHVKCEIVVTSNDNWNEIVKILSFRVCELCIFSLVKFEFQGL